MILLPKRPVVVHVTPWYLPHIGGLERHVEAISNHIGGFDSVILTPRLPGTSRIDRRSERVTIARFGPTKFPARSEEHTSELQSRDQRSFPTRRSSDLLPNRPVVVHVTPWYLPHIGGLERHVEAISNHIGGFDSVILTPRLPGTSRIDRPSERVTIVRFGPTKFPA